MPGIHTKQWRRKTALAFLFTLAAGAASADTEVVKHDPVLDQSVVTTLEQCRQISTSCTDVTRSAYGVLVFPSVVKADLLVGGAGGKGALIEHGKITGYYSIGSVSAGLQAGVENASQVYAFRTMDALNQLKTGPDWKAGASAGVTLITADANASGSTGNVLVYVFDSKGLNAGVSLDVFDVWKTGSVRPSRM